MSALYAQVQSYQERVTTVNECVGQVQLVISKLAAALFTAEYILKTIEKFKTFGSLTIDKM